MENVLVVHFSDFQKLSWKKQNRVYYFIGENFYDLHFIFEGMIVKTTILKSEVNNPQQFFSNQMFYNAIQLQFNISTPKVNLIELVEGIKLPLNKPILPEVQDEEVKNIDIQVEGADTPST